jgi:hypothetical protein
VGEVFKDDPFTGTVRDWPGLNKVLAAARIAHQAGRRRYLLMYDTSRLARGDPWLRPLIETAAKSASAGCPTSQARCRSVDKGYKHTKGRAATGGAVILPTTGSHLGMRAAR